MNIQYYDRFLESQRQGLKLEARKAVNDFIRSFDSDEERKSWTLAFLPTVATTRAGVVRHELFEKVIFPVLYSGYQERDLESILWLVKLIQNLYRSKDLHAKLHNKTDQQLLMECHEIDPSNPEVVRLLLAAKIDWIVYSQHEWPGGILDGVDGASIEGCEGILRQVAFIRTLDPHGKYKETIDGYEAKVVSYMDRLRHARKH